MFYLLQNVETDEFFSCSDGEWITALEVAKENYWEPDGTTFDVACCINDDCEHVDDLMAVYFAMIIIRSEFLEWNGNYTDKRNQVVMYEDAVYLAQALDGTEVNPDLIDFMRKGSFRICSM